MPNDTLAANAASMPKGHVSERDQYLRHRWVTAYAEHLAARADFYAHHDDESDEASEVRSRRKGEAVSALMSTHAPSGWALMQKWAVVEAVLANECESGLSTYPLTIVGLAALKADVLAIGLGES
jgi:hypothetical protein